MPEAWHAWQPARNPPAYAVAWLPSMTTATITASATTTTAAMIMDIFFIATSLPTPLFEYTGNLMTTQQSPRYTAPQRQVLPMRRRLGPYVPCTIPTPNIATHLLRLATRDRIPPGDSHQATAESRVGRGVGDRSAEKGGPT